MPPTDLKPVEFEPVRAPAYVGPPAVAVSRDDDEKRVEIATAPQKCPLLIIVMIIVMKIEAQKALFSPVSDEAAGLFTFKV